MVKFSSIPLWKDISIEQWTDWHWQLQNVITKVDDLEKIINLTKQERDGVEAATKFLKMRITPHIASLMFTEENCDSLKRQFVPSASELISIEDENLFSDVNADDVYSPVKGLVHRYPSKVLLLPTNYCGAYCRYCFRRKLIREKEDFLKIEDYDRIFKYLQDNPNIEEVILSGGDPLVLGDDYIDYILQGIKSISSVQILRIHTRIPVSLPFRITPNLISSLTKVKPIYMVIHVDAPYELSPEMKEAVNKLVDNGIPCLASVPLLKGINDNEVILRKLLTELVKMRVKPYYLFHSDPVKGLRHFLVPMSRGIEIMHNLYDRMSGLAMPQYCFNVPNGGGHVLINHNYIQRESSNSYTITTFDGKQFEYIDDAEVE